MTQAELWVLAVLVVVAGGYLLDAARRTWRKVVDENERLRLENEAVWEQAAYHRVRADEMELRQRHLEDVHRRQVNELQKALAVVQEASTRGA